MMDHGICEVRNGRVCIFLSEEGIEAMMCCVPVGFHSLTEREEKLMGSNRKGSKAEV